jgi:hypothetical protein
VTAPTPEQQQAQVAAWSATPTGQAFAAYQSGSAFYQVEIPHSKMTGIANGFWGSRQGKRTESVAPDVLGQIEASGWRLEHASWVYVQTGQDSRDKFMASGQQVVVTGEVVGVFLFRRDDSAPPSITGPSGWYMDPAGSGRQRWWNGDGSEWTEHYA